MIFLLNVLENKVFLSVLFLCSSDGYFPTSKFNILPENVIRNVDLIETLEKGKEQLPNLCFLGHMNRIVLKKG